MELLTLQSRMTIWHKIHPLIIGGNFNLGVPARFLNEGVDMASIEISFEVKVSDDEPGHKRLLMTFSMFWLLTYWSQDWKEAERFILERCDQGFHCDVIIVDMHFGGDIASLAQSQHGGWL
jgi:hypothetical protein